MSPPPQFFPDPLPPYSPNFIFFFFSLKQTPTIAKKRNSPPPTKITKMKIKINKQKISKIKKKKPKQYKTLQKVHKNTIEFALGFLTICGHKVFPKVWLI